MANITIIEPKTNKIAFYQAIKNVDREVHNGVITYTVMYKYGGGFNLSYVDGEGPEFVSMNTIKVNGVISPLKPTINQRGILTLRRNNTEMAINELVLNLNKLYFGMPAEIGEYNHLFAAKFLSNKNIKEIISIKSGDIVPKSQNGIHWKLAYRIYKVTGKMYKIPSYGINVYGLLGINEKKNKLLFLMIVNELEQAGIIEEVV